MAVSLKYIAAFAIVATLLGSVQAYGGDCACKTPCTGTHNVCAGPCDRKRCVRPMPRTKRCETDPYWVCAVPLKCQLVPGAQVKTCQNPTGPTCRTCDALRCTDGKVCAGPECRKRCVTPMPRTKRCEVDPFWVCAEPLKCQLVPGAQVKTCQNPTGPTCRTCDALKCTGGKVCAGPECSKKCVTPMTRGKRCEVDPFWVCADPLKCQLLPGAQVKTCQNPTGPTCRTCDALKCSKGSRCGGKTCEKTLSLIHI